MAKDNAQGNQTAQDGRELEVLGTCQTQPSMDAQHEHNVTPAQVWSYAQEEALVSVSDQHDHDKCYRLLPDAEDRARRIAARYAGLYFDSAAKSKGKVQFYWPALAAFVVKDIVEAYRFDREGVLNGGWRTSARTSAIPAVVSQGMSGASPYAHAMRVYVALAKGNLWLYMDIYPWLYFFLRFGIKQDGSLNEARIRSHVEQRNATEYQQQSRKAVEDLPFGRAWFGRQQARQANDPVYKRAAQYFETQPVWTGMDGGYSAYTGTAYLAHNYVKSNIASYDGGYHLPVAAKWKPMQEAFYVMEEERIELTRVAKDGKAFERLDKIAKFPTTNEVRKTYDLLIAEFNGSPSDQPDTQLQELTLIAAQEQLNILQPLIYDDQKLKETMDMNHRFARASWGIMTTRYAVIYSAGTEVDDPELETVFDPASGILSGAWDGFRNHQQSLPNATDRMKYVAQIARQFHKLMTKRRKYMETELKTIQKRGGEKHA